MKQVVVNINIAVKLGDTQEQIEGQALGVKLFFEELEKHGINTNEGSVPVHVGNVVPLGKPSILPRMGTPPLPMARVKGEWEQKYCELMGKAFARVPHDIPPNQREAYLKQRVEEILYAQQQGGAVQQQEQGLEDCPIPPDEPEVNGKDVFA